MANDTLTLAQFENATATGKVFTVQFYKRGNGELRTMNCRRGVKKGVKGVGMKYDPKEKNLLGVYDMQVVNDPAIGEKGAFRMINLSDLKTLKLEGKVYNWDATAQEFRV